MPEGRSDFEAPWRSAADQQAEALELAALWRELAKICRELALHHCSRSDGAAGEDLVADLPRSAAQPAEAL